MGARCFHRRASFATPARSLHAVLGAVTLDAMRESALLVIVAIAWANGCGRDPEPTAQAGQAQVVEVAPSAVVDAAQPRTYPRDDPEGGHAELVREAALAFRRFEREAVALARTQLGTERAVALRAALWRDRGMTLSDLTLFIP
jgi:hypothetical protein